LDTRQELYKKICEQVWSPGRFEQIAKTQIQLPESDDQTETPDLAEVEAIDLTTGGYKENSVVYDLYKRLSDGNWHPVKELEKLGGDVNFEGRIGRIRRRGKRTGKWVLEEKDSRIRLRLVEQTNAVQADA
jgi:hypothetical protein